jgi:integrase
VLRKALADAVRWNLIPRNPADAADPPRVVRPAMQTWSLREVRTFLAHVRDDRLFALYRLALATGMRRGEIVGLRWQDVDLDAARLAVVQQLVVVDGWRVEVSEPKTARGRRVLDLDPATVQALRAHRDVQIAERAFMGPDYEDNDLVFCREDGRALHPDKVSQAFTRLARAAGLPPIRFHDLRHTYATLALAAGEYPKVLSERLGHASAAFTLDTYAHVIPSMQQAAAERIAGVLDDA